MTQDVTPQHATDTDPLWTPEEVANYVRADVETVRRCLRQGLLEGVKYRTGSARGSNWRIRRSAVYKWLGMPESGVA